MVGQQVMIKDWFISKMGLTQNERYILSVGDVPVVVKETEKAVNLRIDSDFGAMFCWCPKSCVISYEEWQKEEDAKFAIFEKARQAGLDKYTALVTWAEEHGIKCKRGSIHLKTATILKKIAEAGLTAPAFN